jgi:hypothetical protein
MVQTSSQHKKYATETRESGSEHWGLDSAQHAVKAFHTRQLGSGSGLASQEPSSLLSCNWFLAVTCERCPETQVEGPGPSQVKTHELLSEKGSCYQGQLQSLQDMLGTPDTQNKILDGAGCSCGSFFLMVSKLTSDHSFQKSGWVQWQEYWILSNFRPCGMPVSTHLGQEESGQQEMTEHLTAFCQRGCSEDKEHRGPAFLWVELFEGFCSFLLDPDHPDCKCPIPLFRLKAECISEVTSLYLWPMSALSAGNVTGAPSPW